MNRRSYIQHNDAHESPSLVVLGSKPDPALPEIQAPVVLSANGAATLAKLYKERYGAYVICVVSGGQLIKSPRIRNAVSECRPDEMVITGGKISDPQRFVREELGLEGTPITVIGFYDRYRLMADRIGWKYLIAMSAYVRSKKQWMRIWKDMKKPGRMRWAYCSTGLNAIFYGLNRWPNAKEVVVAGVGLQGGGHFYGEGKMTPGLARVDRMVMKFWKPSARPTLRTTDDAMSEFGKVEKWTGPVFCIDSA